MTEEITDENVKSAIRCAARSLARCEQCRAALERKLFQKEFDKETVRQALDFLEEKHYLDDGRFASIWVKNHCMFKFHGKIRLLKELISKGVSKSVAENAINEYFINSSEEELCTKACAKALQQGKDGEKLLKFLMDSGFPYKMVQNVIKEQKGEKYGTE